MTPALRAALLTDRYGGADVVMDFQNAQYRKNGVYASSLVEIGGTLSTASITADGLVVPDLAQPNYTFSPTYPFTMFVRWRQSSTSGARILWADNTGTAQYVNSAYIAQSGTTQGTSEVRSGNVSYAALTTGSLVTTNRAVLVVGADDARFHCNAGAPQSDVTVTVPVGINVLHLGWHRDGLYMVDGAIQEVRIYNRALTTAEAARLMIA